MCSIPEHTHIGECYKVEWSCVKQENPCIGGEGCTAVAHKQGCPLYTAPEKCVVCIWMGVVRPMPATCEEPGKNVKICANCGSEITTVTPTITSPALGHDWDEGAEQDGKIVYTCNRDTSHTKTEDVPESCVDHVIRSSHTIPATCETAEQRVYDCINCGAEGVRIDTVGEPLGHDWDAGVEQDGEIFYTCNRDASHTKTEHEHKYGDPVNNGNGTHTSACLNCEDETEGKTVTEDHEFIDGKCICGATEGNGNDTDNSGNNGGNGGGVTPPAIDTPDTEEIEDEAVPLAGLFTRADAIGYLWQQSGEPEAELSTFEDVPEDHVWAVAIGWAQDMGIAVADQEGNFRPDDLVLRWVEDHEAEPEGELEEFLNRYAEFAGIELDADELFVELGGEPTDIVMGEDAQVIFDSFFAKLEEALEEQAA